MRLPHNPIYSLALKTMQAHDQMHHEVRHGTCSRILYNYQREELIRLYQRGNDRLQRAIHQAFYSDTEAAMNVLLEKIIDTRLKVDEETLLPDMLLVASHMRTQHKSFTFSQLHSIFIDWDEHLNSLTAPLLYEQMYEHLALLADLTLYKIKNEDLVLWERHWGEDIRNQCSLEEKTLTDEEAQFLLDNYESRDELFTLIKERKPQSIAFLQELMETPSAALMSGVL